MHIASPKKVDTIFFRVRRYATAWSYIFGLEWRQWLKWCKQCFKYKADLNNNSSVLSNRSTVLKTQLIYINCIYYRIVQSILSVLLNGVMILLYYLQDIVGHQQTPDCISYVGLLIISCLIISTCTSNKNESGIR